jgi:hypothetical protein
MLACLVLMLPAAAAAAPERPGPAGLPVVMTPQPGTALDRTARSLAAQDLAEARRAGDRPLVLVGSVPLGTASERPALFVQLQSPRQCGSRGCSTSAYLWTKGRWAKVLDDASGRIALLPTKHGGMADLAANAEHYAWTGTAYANTRPAPAVDLRPHAPRRRHP